MKRAAFTMIELIFVIVILGILATIALPKLASLEDDAYVSKEKSAVGSARSSVITLQSRAKLTSADTFAYKFEEFSTTAANHGKEHIATFTVAATGATGVNSVSNYPNSLSVADQTTDTTPAYAGTTAGAHMALVLSADERDVWTTALAADGASTKIQGPASAKITAGSAEYDLSGSWLYRPATGRFDYNNTVYSAR